MSKAKSGTNIFAIIFKSLMIYLKNFMQLSKVMLFPVLGQIIGMVLIFYPTYMYKELYLAKLSAENIQHGLIFLFIGLILIIIPGFAVFLKAFWDYMIAMASLNTMISDITKKGFMGSIKLHNSTIKLKANEYIPLLLIMSLFWLILIIFPFSVFFLGIFVNSVIIGPIFLLMVSISVIIALIFSVNLCLVFQIFAFEALPAMEIIKKSWNLMKGNFWRTFFMGTVLLIITSIIVPGFVSSVIEKSPLINYLTAPFKAYVDLFSRNQVFMQYLVGAKMTPASLSMTIALSTVCGTITAMLLPLGSTCFTLLYFDILERKMPKTTKAPKK